MSKSKFELARDEAAEKSKDLWSNPIQATLIKQGFTKGAEFGASYERKRAEKIVSRLKEVRDDKYERPETRVLCDVLIKAYEEDV